MAILDGVTSKKYLEDIAKVEGISRRELDKKVKIKPIVKYNGFIGLVEEMQNYDAIVDIEYKSKKDSSGEVTVEAYATGIKLNL